MTFGEGFVLMRLLQRSALGHLQPKGTIGRSVRRSSANAPKCAWGIAEVAPAWRKTAPGKTVVSGSVQRKTVSQSRW